MSTIWEETDGCTKQYIFETFFYILSIKYVGINVIIDCDVGTPVNGKDVVDIFNTVEKQYLNKSVFSIFHREEKYTQNEMNDHMETPNGTTIISLEDQRVLNHMNME